MKPYVEIKFNELNHNKPVSINSTQIIIPKGFHVNSNNVYKCILNKTNRIWTYKGKRLQLVIAKQYQTNELIDDIPTGQGTMAQALIKAGLK